MACDANQVEVQKKKRFEICERGKRFTVESPRSFEMLSSTSMESATELTVASNLFRDSASLPPPSDNDVRAGNRISLLDGGGEPEKR